MANLTGTQLQSKLLLLLRDTSDVSDGLLLLHLNMADDMFYRELTRLDPDRFLVTKTYYGATTYDLPTDFSNIRTGSIFATEEGETFSILQYESPTGTFSVGQVVTGADSEAFGTIDEIDTSGTKSYLTLSSVTDAFEDAEEISTATGTATTFGVEIPFEDRNNKLLERGWGELSESFNFINGYRITNDQIIVEDPEAPIRLRYTPDKAELATLADETVLDRQFQNVYLNELQKMYFRWSEDSANFNWEEQMFANTLDELRNHYQRTSRVIRFKNRKHLYYSNNRHN